MASSITTLAGLFAEVVRLLDSEEPSTEDLPFLTLTRLLRNAERDIYRGARTRYNELEWPGTTLDNELELPDDFVAASLVHFGREPLIPVPEVELLRRLRNGSGDEAREFAECGTVLKFWPAVSDGTTVQGRYYARLPDLADANIADNALFQAADDLFIFAMLAQAGDFFHRPQMVATWSAKAGAIMATLNEEARRYAYSAGSMRRRPSARLMQGA